MSQNRVLIEENIGRIKVEADNFKQEIADLRGNLHVKRVEDKVQHTPDAMQALKSSVDFYQKGAEQLKKKYDAYLLLIEQLMGQVKGLNISEKEKSAMKIQINEARQLITDAREFNKELGGYTKIFLEGVLSESAKIKAAVSPQAQSGGSSAMIAKQAQSPDVIKQLKSRQTEQAQKGAPPPAMPKSIPKQDAAYDPDREAIQQKQDETQKLYQSTQAPGPARPPGITPTGPGGKKR